MSEKATSGGWWVYLIRCGDNTLYCGIARDVEKRMQDHATPKGARYVRSHGGVSAILWRHETTSRSAAQSIEAWVKRQSRSLKLALAAGVIQPPEGRESEAD